MVKNKTNKELETAIKRATTKVRKEKALEEKAFRKSKAHIFERLGIGRMDVPGRQTAQELIEEVETPKVQREIRRAEEIASFDKGKDVFEELGIERMDRRGPPGRQTAQELVEEVETPKVRRELRSAALQRVKQYVSRPSRVSPSVRKLDTKVGDVVRKAVHLLAPKTSMVRRITATGKKKVAGRGRGRPRQTYKTRVLPSGKVVKVPTAMYKKMLKQEKATFRLAQAQRQAMLQQQAEQIAMTQDPRFQPSAEETWADSEDMEHEAEVQRLKQQQLMQQQMYQQPQTMTRRAGEMFSKARTSLFGTQEQYPQYQQVQQLQRPDVKPYPRPQIDTSMHRPVNPQVVLMSGKSPMFGGKGNIMDQRNEFNETKKATIGFGRKTI